MKKYIVLMCILGTAWASFGQEKEIPEPKWADFAKIIANEKQDKLTMVYVYNTPCHLCKNMEADILSDSTIIKTLQKDFVVVRFFAASEEEYTYKGSQYPFTLISEDAGVNILAILLLDGQMGYPTCVFLDKNNDKIGMHYAPKDVDEMAKILKYYTSGAYKESPYEEWIKNN